MKKLPVLLVAAGIAGAAPVYAADSTVHYELVFNATWSQLTHPHPNGPEAFPDEPRFSPLVGAVHNDSVYYWRVGEFASLPIEAITEDGNPSPFLTLLNNDVAANTALGALYYQEGPKGPIVVPGVARIPRFRASTTFPLVTLLTMVGPSPDWIVGVDSLSLLDETGEWYEELVIELYPYDGGTEEGIEYDLENPPTIPAEPIHDITGEPPLSDLPLGTFTFRKLPAMPSFLSLEWNFAWNTGENGHVTTTLYIDRTFYDSAGRSGSWRFSAAGPSLTLTSENNDGCRMTMNAQLLTASQFEGNLNCTSVPARQGVAAGQLIPVPR